MPPCRRNTSASDPCNPRRHDPLSRTLNSTPGAGYLSEPHTNTHNKPKPAHLQDLLWARLGSNQRPLACEALPHSRLQGLMFLQIERLWRRIAGAAFGLFAVFSAAFGTLSGLGVQLKGGRPGCCAGRARDLHLPRMRRGQHQPPRRCAPGGLPLDDADPVHDPAAVRRLALAAASATCVTLAL